MVLGQKQIYRSTDQNREPRNNPTHIYPKKRKTLFGKDTCTPMFIMALFIIAKIWKQPKYPSTYEWIKNICYTHTHTHTHTGITLLCSVYIYIYTYTHTHNGILFSHKKEGNLAICNKELEGYYVSEVSLQSF